MWLVSVGPKSQAWETVEGLKGVGGGVTGGSIGDGSAEETAGSGSGLHDKGVPLALNLGQ